VPLDELEHDLEALTERLSASPTVALGLTKWLLAASHTETLPGQLHNEALALELSSRSEDFKEGLGAFGEKRPPRFTGR
jgi:2-(1,2-epoxy-1,2-dihydrophenyl)acetyl-CoA isomerase